MNTIAEKVKVTAGAPYATLDFNSLKPADCTLRIFLNNSQLAYHVAHLETKRIYLIQPYHFSRNPGNEEFISALESVFDNDTLLKENYSDQKIGCFTPSFTLIPDQFYNEKNSEEYLWLNVPKTENDIVYHDRLTAPDAHIVYSLPEDLSKLFSNYFPNASIHHSLTGLLPYLVQENNKGAKTARLYAFLQTESVQVISIDNGMLRLCNSFEYRTPEDLVYHLLNVYRELQKDPHKNELILLGEIERNSSLFQLISKYVRNIQFGKRPVGWRFDTDYHFADNFYYNLFCI